MTTDHKPVISIASHRRLRTDSATEIELSLGVHIADFPIIAIDYFEAFLFAGPAENDRQPFVLLDHEHLDKGIVAASQGFDWLTFLYVHYFYLAVLGADVDDIGPCAWTHHRADHRPVFHHLLQKYGLNFAKHPALQITIAGVPHNLPHIQRVILQTAWDQFAARAVQR